MENQYLEELNQERRKYRELERKHKKTAKISGAVLNKMMKAVEDRDLWVWPFALMLALLNDFLDLLIIGSIPIIGDIIDLFTGFILFMFLLNLGGHIRIKVRAVIFAASFFELIPLVDFIPVWTISILYAWHITRQEGEKAEQTLKKIRTKVKKADVFA